MEAAAKPVKHMSDKAMLISVAVSLYPKVVAKEVGRRYMPSPADRARFLRDREVNEPIVFKMLVQGSSGLWVVFPPGGAQPSVSLSYVKELSRVRRTVSTLQIGLGHGAICGSLVRTETIGVQKKIDSESLFEFPFQVVDRFLTRVAVGDRLRPLTDPPVVVGAVLREQGFEYVPLKTGVDHVEAFGARWVATGEEVSSSDVWYGFSSHFARVALNYTVFSPDVQPPFIAEMTSIHKTEAFNSEGFKKDVDSRVAFTGTARKIDLLEQDTPYAPSS